MLEEVEVREMRVMTGGYYACTMESPVVAPLVRPGQFIHLRVPRLEVCVLRRPFSVYKSEGSLLTILFKSVGKGTQALSAVQPGDRFSIIGPLGHGFPNPANGAFPVLIAGGYGMAALYMIARQASGPEASGPGLVFVGGRTRQDILCVDAFEALGWDVRPATEDGSLGVVGLVTRPLDAWLAQECGARTPEFFACGPNPMLQAVSQRALARDVKAWISMDRHMGCGVGACLTCVQQIKRADGTWTWARTCREGPVFECRDIQWDDQDKGGAV